MESYKNAEENIIPTVNIYFWKKKYIYELFNKTQWI